MIAFVPIALLFATCLVVVVLELRSRRPVAAAARRERVGHAFMLGLISLVVLSPALALIFDRPLPVEPPVDPHAGEGCGDSSSAGDELVVLAIVIYLGARSGIGIVAAIARAVAGAPKRLVSGHAGLTVAAFALALTHSAAWVRVLMPGPTPDDFATYGALTPDHGAEGWRAELMLRRARRGPLVEIPHGPALASDVEERRSSSHGSWSSGSRLKDGLHAWVGGEPVIFYLTGDGVAGASVEQRSRNDVPPERRPHFQTWPRVAPAAGGGWIFIERRPDGASFALETYASATATGVDQREVWLLVRPSPWPLVIATLLGLLGLWAAVTAHRRGDAAGLGLVASWLWLEAAALDLFAYAPYLGL